MTDLEDDVLLAYIKQGKELLTLRDEKDRLTKRDFLQEQAWKAFDQLLQKLLQNKEIRAEAENEIYWLKTKLRDIIDFDEAAARDEQ